MYDLVYHSDAVHKLEHNVCEYFSGEASVRDIVPAVYHPAISMASVEPAPLAQ